MKPKVHVADSSFTCKLRDTGDDPDKKFLAPIELTVKCDGRTLALFARDRGTLSWYGTNPMGEGHGFPVALEVYNGELRLLVWADINQEEATHIISLEGAREINRNDR